MREHNPRIEDLRRRVLKDPASIAFAQLAEEYRRAGDFEDAVDVCRAGLAKHPGYLSARVTLGRALLELGQLEAACQELHAVIAGAPDNLAAIRGLADIAQRRGRLKEALTLYRRALGLARNDPDLQQLVADLTRQVARVPAGVATPTTNTKPKSDPSGLLTLEQLTAELQQAALPPVPVQALVATVESGSDRPSPGHEGVATAADLRRLALLERWLTAIDGFRAERRA